jgi:hypothetical protein
VVWSCSRHNLRLDETGERVDLGEERCHDIANDYWNLEVCFSGTVPSTTTTKI